MRSNSRMNSCSDGATVNDEHVLVVGLIRVPGEVVGAEDHHLAVDDEDLFVHLTRIAVKANIKPADWNMPSARSRGWMPPGPHPGHHGRAQSGLDRRGRTASPRGFDVNEKARKSTLSCAVSSRFTITDSAPSSGEK